MTSCNICGCGCTFFFILFYTLFSNPCLFLNTFLKSQFKIWLWLGMNFCSLHQGCEDCVWLVWQCVFSSVMLTLVLQMEASVADWAVAAEGYVHDVRAAFDFLRELAVLKRPDQMAIGMRPVINVQEVIVGLDAEAGERWKDETEPDQRAVSNIHSMRSKDGTRYPSPQNSTRPETAF